MLVSLSPFSSSALAGPAPDQPIFDSQSSDNIDPALMAEMRRQDVLQPALKIITEEAAQATSPGYAGLAFEGDGLTVYYKGPIPSGMQNALTEARTHGEVTVQPASFSRMELQAAAVRVEDSLIGRSDIQAIEVKHDGSGLGVEKMPADRVDVARANATRNGRPFVEVDATLNGADFGVPVEVAVASSPFDLLACASTCNRLDDTSAWNGGTRTLNPDADVANPYYKCTTGFGVTKGSTSYVLTADHCATAPDLTYDNKLELMGGVYAGNWDKDLLLINARGYYKIFDGSPTTSTTKNVMGWGYHASGEYLCHSGASTGTRCGLRTDGGDYALYGCDSDGDCFNRHGLIKTTQVDGLTAAAAGDSGGPVFSLMTGGVRAKGILIGGGNSTMYFQDWADVINIFGAYPRTP
ncbi:hypothetical protein CA850_06285 [Micromonospora echinospora]|nr:hypothetical protein CA850_06285 [Micromonospora echinospora]